MDVKQLWTDRRIYEVFLDGRNAAEFTAAYQALIDQFYPMMVNFFQQQGRDAQVAEEFTFDVLCLFYEKVQQGRFTFQPSAKLTTFLYSMARFKWLSESRKMKRQTGLDAEHENIQQKDGDMEFDVAAILLEQLMVLGQKCHDLLWKFHIERVTMKELAEMLGYANDKVAKTAKNKCRIKLIKQLKEAGYQASDFGMEERKNG